MNARAVAMRTLGAARGALFDELEEPGMLERPEVIVHALSADMEPDASWVADAGSRRRSAWPWRHGVD